jgi:hypothetical protein
MTVPCLQVTKCNRVSLTIQNVLEQQLLILPDTTCSSRFSQKVEKNDKTSQNYPDFYRRAGPEKKMRGRKNDKTKDDTKWMQLKKFTFSWYLLFLL